MSSRNGGRPGWYTPGSPGEVPLDPIDAHDLGISDPEAMYDNAQRVVQGLGLRDGQVPPGVEPVCGLRSIRNTPVFPESSPALLDRPAAMAVACSLPAAREE
jgi:hypothetical protein